MKKEYFYYLLITLAFVIMATFNACKPEPEPEPNTPGSVKVTTSSVSNITETSAKCGGTVTASGYSVGACGLCYSELPNPTVNSYITSDQIGTGTFTSTMSGLEPGTKYYVRAYATTSSGTLYGEQKEFTTLGDNNGGDDDNDDNGGGNGGDDEEATKPTVTTNSVSNITFESATCGGNVTDDGGANVTARGVCWSTSQNPTIYDNKTTDSSGIGSFTSNLINLNENTTYYVRAYATNEKGTSYGEQKSFTTLDDPTDGTINGYAYVDLGLPSGLKWATCNVGASSPEDYGNYYAWGETTTKSTYIKDNSLTYGLSNSQLQSQGYIDGSGNLTPSHDAATANWGGSWRMPTETELEELEDKCTWTWTTQNGVKGCKLTGPNGNHIFLPAAGYRYGSSLYYDGDDGYYWSSSPNDGNGGCFAHSLFFYDGGENAGWNDVRGCGLTVRPISE